jgi:hypothetical protein
MHPWICAGLIAVAGAAGGLVNAMLSEAGLAAPRTVKGIWCPGALSTIVIGALAAFASWAFYGSEAGIDLAERTSQAHLQLSALAGAFLVGVVGAKWIENESAKRVLQASVKVAAPLIMPKEKAENIPLDSPSRVLQEVAEACEHCPPYASAIPARPASA